MDSTLPKWCRSRTEWPNPDSRAISSMFSSVDSRSSCARSTRCEFSQAAGVAPVSDRKRRANVRGRHVDPGREFVHGVLVFEVADHPPQQLFHGLRTAGRNGTVDELRLPAVAVGRDHHVAGNARRHVGAEFHPHQVKAGINAGRGACTADDPAVLDVQDIFVHQGRRVAAGQHLRIVPMRRASAPVQQSGPRQCEGAGTDGHHPGATGMGGPQGVQNGFGDVLVVAVRGHDHEVRIGGCFQPQLHVHGQAGFEPDIARLRRADAEIEGRYAGSPRRPVNAEHLERGPELEDGKVGNNNHCH